MGLINHYSLLWGGLIVLGLVAIVLWRKGFQRKDGLKLLVLVVVLFVAWLLLRPAPASTTELTQFQAELGQGQAVLLELQSPY